MLDGKGENEIDSSMARIRVEDDWTDGLTSRYVTTRHSTIQPFRHYAIPAFRTANVQMCTEHFSYFALKYRLT